MNGMYGIFWFHDAEFLMCIAIVCVSILYVNCISKDTRIHNSMSCDQGRLMRLGISMEILEHSMCVVLKVLIKSVCSIRASTKSAY